MTLIISDVTGDDPTHIASGPCAPDPTTYQDAVDVLNRFDVKPPQAVLKHLISGLRGEREETPKPGSPVFAKVENHVIATARRSLEAAAKLFRDNGIEPVILGDSITGEAKEVAKVMAAHRARDPRSTARRSSRRWRCSRAANARSRSAAPADAAGAAPNSCSALGLELDGAADVHAIAADTDGIDGSENNAGALLAPDSLARARAQGLDPRKYLAGQRQLRDFFGARRPGGHRADAHQRQRLPGDTDHANVIAEPPAIRRPSPFPSSRSSFPRPAAARGFRAVDQRDQRHRRVVALAETALQDAQVAAVALGVARAELAEELRRRCRGRAAGCRRGGGWRASRVLPSVIIGSTTRRSSFALGSVVLISSCVSNATAMLRNMASRWLVVRLSLRSPWP